MAKYDKENHRFIPRDDAVKHEGRWIVPTVYGQESGNTKWLEPADLLVAGVIWQFNEDQTEITLHAPEGTKFGCGFPEAVKKLIPLPEVEVLSCPNGCCNSVECQEQPPKEYEGEDLTALTIEYQEWCRANNLPYIDAADLVLRDELLTGEQHEWVQEFCQRWEVSAHLERTRPPKDFLTVESPSHRQIALSVWADDPARIKEILYVPSDAYGRLFVFVNENGEYWSIDGREEILTTDRAEAFKWALEHR